MACNSKGPLILLLRMFGNNMDFFDWLADELLNTDTDEIEIGFGEDDNLEQIVE